MTRPVIPESDIIWQQNSGKNWSCGKITFCIFEGEKLLVEKINIKGNSVTNESVIRSELIIDEGDPFNSLKLKINLYRLHPI